MEVKLMGLVLGTASGWDQVDDDVVYFYAFVPEHYKLVTEKMCDFSIDQISGKWDLYEEGGETIVLSGTFMSLMQPGG